MATCAFAVGARVPFIATGVGAVATQAFVNPYFGYRGLELLRAGASAEDAVRDADVERRGHAASGSFTCMDADGRFAAYTGAGCVDWCGHLVRETFLRRRQHARRARR